MLDGPDINSTSRRRATTIGAATAVASLVAAITYVIAGWPAARLSASPAPSPSAPAPSITSLVPAPPTPLATLTSSDAPVRHRPGSTRSVPQPPVPGPSKLPVPPPDVPVEPVAAASDLTATPVSASAVRLEWTDNATNEARYELLYLNWDALPPEGAPGVVYDSVVLPANTTSYVLTGLDEATNYCFTVFAAHDYFVSQPVSACAKTLDSSG